jgi:hypothetical protein
MTVLFAVLSVSIAMLFPSVAAAVEIPFYCKNLEDMPVDFRLEHWAKCRRLQQEAREAEQKAEEDRLIRDVKVDIYREEAARRRAEECAAYGTCPSTSQDLREQLKRQK